MREGESCYRGKLLVADYLGRKATGEKVYACYCACGVQLERTDAELERRKLLACDTCRAEQVEARLEAKKEEIRKNHRRVRNHAHVQSACS